MHHWVAWLGAGSQSGLNRDTCGYLASTLVLTTFSMKSMRGLRISAIASNIAFITYALMAGLLPILILHSILLPLNIVRLVQIELALVVDRRRGAEQGMRRFGTLD
jgi:hypothetical protein